MRTKKTKTGKKATGGSKNSAKYPRKKTEKEQFEVWRKEWLRIFKKHYPKRNPPRISMRGNKIAFEWLEGIYKTGGKKK